MSTTRPLMFVGDAPTAVGDGAEVPIAGRAAELLAELLGEIGLSPADVHVTTALEHPTPGNRDPTPPELERSREWLASEFERVEPAVVCTLGNFATRLLRGEPTPITKLRGQAEIRTLGPRAVRLLPLFHPAAALYQPENVELLRADFGEIPGLLALGAPPQPEPPDELSEPPEAEEPPADQLGLF